MEFDSPIIDSVFDFLYVDRARIALFASQLLEEGSTGTVRRTRTAVTGETFKVGASLGPASTGYETPASSTDAVEHTSDAYWNAVIGVLGALQKGGFLATKLDEVTIGRLIQFRGYIQITDLGFIRQIWKPLINTHFAQRGEKMSPAKQREIEDTAQVLAAFPHSLQLHANTEDLEYKFWGPLRHEHVVGSSDDLALMHGAHIRGVWNVIGVLDVGAEFSAEKLMKFEIGSELLNGFQDTIQQIRLQFGRPLDANGITPLCIFRAISPNPLARANVSEAAA